MRISPAACRRSVSSSTTSDSPAPGFGRSARMAPNTVPRAFWASTRIRSSGVSVRSIGVRVLFRSSDPHIHTLGRNSTLTPVLQHGGEELEGMLNRHPGDIGEVQPRSEEHTSELQSLMRTSYAVFCLK